VLLPVLVVVQDLALEDVRDALGLEDLTGAEQGCTGLERGQRAPRITISGVRDEAEDLVIGLEGRC